MSKNGNVMDNFVKFVNYMRLEKIPISMCGKKYLVL